MDRSSSSWERVRITEASVILYAFYRKLPLTQQFVYIHLCCHCNYICLREAQLFCPSARVLDLSRSGVPFLALGLVLAVADRPAPSARGEAGRQQSVASGPAGSACGRACC